MNLVRELDNLAVEQIVYTPIRGTNNVGKNAIEFASDKSEVIYSSILNWHIDRVFYPYKIFKIFKDIQRKVDFSQINFIHAHTWYSDGGVAYFLSKKYNIPFITTIRSTDLNTFYKKMVYLRPFGRKVLEHAGGISGIGLVLMLKQGMFFLFWLAYREELQLTHSRVIYLLAMYAVILGNIVLGLGLIGRFNEYLFIFMLLALPMAIKSLIKQSQQHFVLFSAWLMLTVISLQGLLFGAQGVVL